MQLKEYLESRITLTTSLEQMSRHIHKSASQTIRLFRQEYGITPYQYLMRRKIETACLILNNTSLPIQEIARRLRFTDEHYFSNYFKARVGKSRIITGVGHSTPLWPTEIKYTNIRFRTAEADRFIHTHGGNDHTEDGNTPYG